MQGDELAILLFWLTLSVGFGAEAVKAETLGRRLGFGSFAILFLASGVLWHQVSPLWPALTNQVALVATNPVTWFVLFMFVAAIFAFHRPKPNLRPEKAPTESAIGAPVAQTVKDAVL